MQSSVKNKADHLLYRTYYKLCIEDILFHLGEQEQTKFYPTKENKDLLHDFHKRILGYDTIAEESYDVVSKFIQEVCQFWAMERGIFVRTSKNQPFWIGLMGLADIVEVEGKEKRVWDLL